MLKIAEIKEIEKHPNADKLIVTKVDIKENDLIQVVTNDTSLNVGDKVVLAKVGHEFSDFKIEERKVRGILSMGMFCGNEVTNIEGTGVSRLGEKYIIGAEFVIC